MEANETFAAVTDWIVFLVIAFILFVIYVGWFASYRTSKAAPVGTSIWFKLPAWGQIAAGLAISVIGAYCGYLLWIPIAVSLSSGLMLVLRIAGMVLSLSGAVLFLWSRWTLGAMYNASTSSAVQLQANHRLIKHGPYALVRHPIYLSYWLILFGLLVMYRTWMLLFALIMMLISLSKRASREEQVLEATFGDVWREYAREVPRFIPHWRQIHYG